jgi:hypothetical protein
MKNLVLISLFLLISSVLFSCKKNSEKPTAATIVGNWHLVSDSSYLATGNSIVNSSNYKGTSSDNYNFKSDGGLSWHENNMGSDSASYSVKADTVTITYLPKSNPKYAGDVTDSYKMTLMSNKMVLNTYLVTADGVAYDIMTFSR